MVYVYVRIAKTTIFTQIAMFSYTPSVTRKRTKVTQRHRRLSVDAPEIAVVMINLLEKVRNRCLEASYDE